jgi:hypothetical protein
MHTDASPAERRMDDAARGSGRTGWLVDGHVHLHDGFAIDTFLAAAAANLDRAARHVGAGPGSLGCLCLADSARERGFERLRAVTAFDWEALATDEDASLLVARHGVVVMAVLAGIQILTRERLEVLVLGCTDRLPDGEAIERTLERARATDGAVVLPWGFGKWMFGRGRTARRLLAHSSGHLLAGDNGNRPALLPAPALLRQARQLGVTVLPGSDPLPLPTHAGRAGSFGAFIECSPDMSRPAHQIVGLLGMAGTRLERFGEPERLRRFAAAQAVLRMRRGSGARHPSVSL